MPTALRNTLAVLAGIVTAFLVVMLVEMLGHRLFPVPAGLDFNDKAAMAAFVRTLPVGALLCVLLAWVSGSFSGAWLAARLAVSRRPLLSGVVGLFVLAASITNLMMLPHPLWFSITAVIAVPAAAWLAGRLASAGAAR